MRIVIVGAGLVGATLARHLVRAGYDVSIIDQEASALNDLAETLDILTVQGNGVSPSVLDRAGIGDADLLIAATPSDELNIVVCSIGQIKGVSKRFARIRNDELATQLSLESLEKLGVTRVIQPESVVVERILQFIDTPGVTDAANFHDDTLLLRGIEIRPDSPLVGNSLASLREIISIGPFLIIAVIRDGLGVLPTGDFILEPGDIAYIMYHRNGQENFFRLSGLSSRPVNKIVISGDSLIAFKLCQALEKRHIGQILWLVQNEDYALRMEGRLSSTEVLSGSGMEVDVLREVQVKFADFYISVSDETEENILSALLAKSIGAHETISISSESRFNDLFQSIGISHVISPRLVTAQQIMREIRTHHFGIIQRLGATDLDVIQLEVGEISPASGKSLIEVWKMVKAKFLIALIIRGDDIFIPQGRSLVLSGDTMIIVTKSKNKHTLQKLFGAI